MKFDFDNSFARLNEAFYRRVDPTPVVSPELLLWNEGLTANLQLNEKLQEDSLKAQYFSGNKLPDDADAMALAYCGHQFGQLNPQLGDGRAHLLGELLDGDNHRVDLQLKGSGPTPFSRQGDGRCALGPALREYIMSEAMFYLGVPTSRCLAVVATGEPVYRETAKPGAVVTRVAASHIRVGTFQFFAIRRELESLTALLDYTIDRHFPEINKTADAGLEKSATISKAERVISAVMHQQITLVVEWMRVGFIHGVMNTDNTAISGETIDYGPCAMMGAYDPATVYSSIDRQGRYSFGNQPGIALWNVTRLAESLLPLIDDDEKKAVAAAEQVLAEFGECFESAYYTMLANKLGLPAVNDNDRVFIAALLDIMQNQQLDYTQTFEQLTESLSDETIAKGLTETLGDWYEGWRAFLLSKNITSDGAQQLMRERNPVVIPRNHHVEAVLQVCEEQGNAQAAEDFLAVLRSPYQALPATKTYQDLPADGDQSYRTFCGT